MKKHGNSNENEAEHHLYEIHDVERDDVYKYGICGDPLNPMEPHLVPTVRFTTITALSDGYVFWPESFWRVSPAGAKPSELKMNTSKLIGKKTG